MPASSRRLYGLRFWEVTVDSVRHSLAPKMGEPWKRRLQQLSVTEKHVPLRNQLQRSISVPAPVHKLHLSTGAIAINLGAFFGSWAVACELTTPSRGNFCGSLWLRMLASSYAQFISSAPASLTHSLNPRLWQTQRLDAQRGALFRRLHERELGKRRHRELAIRRPVDRREVKKSLLCGE